ncbi:DUF3293 domain-containing protein [Luteimonas sp. FCS-9]|uniref:DUF3293 domain-containing protein n=1 Tax=Luteimonas sp. FCS-9 TaxID=1547516 RepID=UPI00063EA431|nr:DUF3293 domain-containing protein [Luteimonas sp. FCS-9]KLJ01627.1 hypothetical protein WQ56_04930 [Luteimonas sp. FCS-9]
MQRRTATDAVDAPRAQLDPDLLEAWLQARYRWRAPDRRWHPLAPGRRAAALERLHPGAAGFGVVTAWNPGGRACAGVDNRRAGRALDAALEAVGIRRHPSCADAPDGGWLEPGRLLVDVDAGTLDALADRFGQLGTLWWPRGEPVRLRLAASAPAWRMNDPRIAWRH